MVKIKVLGCGDAFSTGGRFTSSFYVKTGTKSFLIDCGNTTLTALKKNNISSRDIDYIFLSHFHGDHFGGLPYFILDAAIMENRTKELIIYSPEGCEKKLRDLFSMLYPGSEGTLKKFPINYKSFKTGEKVKAGEIEFTALSVIHTKATLPHGLRFKLKDKILAYSGDTEWTDELIPLSKDADLFICECNFFNKSIKGHLSYKTFLEKQKDLSCKKILLTHLGTEMLEKSDIKWDRAEDGLVIEL